MMNFFIVYDLDWVVTNPDVGHLDYRRANAAASFAIDKCLHDNDRQAYDPTVSAKEKWSDIQRKYEEKDLSRERLLMRDLYSYLLPPDLPVREGYTHLNLLATRIVNLNPLAKPLLNGMNVFQILLASLPPEFDQVVDSLDARYADSGLANEVTIEQSIRILERKEQKLRGDEIGMYAKNSSKPVRGKNVDSGRHGRGQQKGSGGPSQGKCYLCHLPDHRIAKCKYYPKFVKLREECIRKAKSSDHRSKSKPKQRQRGTWDKHISSKSDSENENAFVVGDESDSGPDTDNAMPNNDVSDSQFEDELAAVAATSEMQAPCTTWVLDTGASSHMTDSKVFFPLSVTPISNKYVRVGGGRLPIRGIGTGVVHLGKSGSIELPGMLFVPNLGVNLISVSALVRNAGWKGIVVENSFHVYDHHGKVMLSAKPRGGTWILYSGCTEVALPAIVSNSDILAQYEEDPPATAVGAPTVGAPDLATDPVTSAVGDISLQRGAKRYQLWHKRLGHLGSSKLRHLHKAVHGLQPIPMKFSSQDVCEPCAVAKLKLKKGPLSAPKSSPLELVSVDICGPLPESLSGNTYFIQLVENFSRKYWVIPIKKRADAPTMLLQWRKEEETQGRTLRAIRSDNGTELKKEFDSWTKKYGTRVEYTTPYSSFQNGVAERGIQAIEAGCRTLLAGAKLPPLFWDEAAITFAYIRNRSTTVLRPVPLETRAQAIQKDFITPEELFTGIRPSLDHMKIWGCKCFAYVDPKSIPAGQRRDKLVDRGRIAIFVGYGKSSRQWRVYAPDRQAVVVASSVRFSEQEMGNTVDLRRPSDQPPIKANTGFATRNPRGRPRKAATTTAADPLNDKAGTPVDSPPAAPIPAKSPVKPDSAPDSLLDPLPDSLVDRSLDPLLDPSPNLEQEVTPRVAPEPAPESMPISDVASNLKQNATSTAPHVAAPEPPIGPPQKGKRRVSDTDTLAKPTDTDMTDPDPSLRYADRSIVPVGRSKIRVVESVRLAIALLAEAHDTSENHPAAISKYAIKTPMSYKEAVNGPYADQWRHAVDLELQALKQNNTWTIVPTPANANVVTAKWVFQVKYLPDGTVDRFKARLVARGFSQQYGVDFTETFAPTMRIDSLRMLIALMAIEDMEVCQLDVSNAFTQAKLKEQIYMKAPDGVSVSFGECLKLLSSLYGLKQAARDWHKLSSAEMLSMGFRQCQSDPCVFIHENGVVVGNYVDDFFVLAPRGKQSLLRQFVARYSRRFKTRVVAMEADELTILGLCVRRDRKRLLATISLHAYIQKLLVQYDMRVEGKTPVNLPIPPTTTLCQGTSEDEPADPKAYQRMIGSVMYAMVYARPDIAFAASRLGRYMAQPTAYHFKALKTLVRYLRSTSHRTIAYGSKVTEGVEGYADSDWAADKDDRKSTTGVVYTLGGGAISWASRKQKSVSTSTTEAEYVALSIAARQGLWICQLMSELGREAYIRRIRIKSDNEGALSLVKNPRVHDRSKHIDIVYHHVRDLYARGKVTVGYVPTKEQPADMLTKVVPREQFERNLHAIGMRSNSQSKREC